MKLKGSVGDVTLLCPSAWIGLAERSTWLMLPSEIFWKVATAVTCRRLMLAVNGFDKVNSTEAIPVWTILAGKSRVVLVIKFWCKAGITTGESFISDRAN